MRTGMETRRDDFGYLSRSMTSDGKSTCSIAALSRCLAFSKVVLSSPMIYPRSWSILRSTPILSWLQ